MSNPWIVEPETKQLDIDVPGLGTLWIKVKARLSVGEQRRMLRGVTPMKFEQGASAPQMSYEWTEYSFARMVAYVVDWQLAHLADEAQRLKPTRESYEKLQDFVFDAIDKALDAHEKAVADEKKAQSGGASPATT